MTGLRHRRAVLAVASVVFAPWLLVGCGGGGVRQTGTQVTVLVYSGGALTNAQWVAFQDGAGTWTRLQPTSSGHYTANVTSTDHRYGVAIVTTDWGMPWVNVYRATTTEMTRVVLNHMISPVTGPVVSGTEAGYAAGDFVNVFVGLASGGGVARSTYTCSATAPGIQDILADLTDSSGVVLKYILDRNVNITSNYTRNLDFSGADAITPTTFTVTTAGPVLSGIYCTATLRTANGSQAVAGGYHASCTGYALPTAERNAGDVYTASAQTWTSSGSDYTANQTFQAFTTPADQTVTLASTLSASVSSVATTPYVRYQATVTPWPNASSYNLTAFGSNVRWRVEVTAGWLGTAMAFSMPDLTSVTGWDTAWSSVASGSWGVGAARVVGSYQDYVAQIDQQLFPGGMTVQTSLIDHNVE